MAIAKFAYSLHNDKIIFIQDIGNEKNMTVTNDIENVLYDISKQLSIDEYRIIYSDSECTIDGVRTKNGEFYDFYSINVTNLDEAMLMTKPNIHP